MDIDSQTYSDILRLRQRKVELKIEVFENVISFRFFRNGLLLHQEECDRSFKAKVLALGRIQKWADEHNYSIEDANP